MQLYLNYKCTGECKSGVLLRAKKAADGMTGVFVSLADGDTGYYSVALDASGKDVARPAVRARTWRRRSAGRQRRSWWCAGADDAGAGRGGGRGGRGGDAPTPAAQATPPPARGTQVGSGGRARPTLKAGEWNAVNITIGQEGPASGSPAGTAGPNRVLSTFGPTATAAVDEKNATAFGAIALYVGGSGEVRFKDFAWKDLMRSSRTRSRSLPGTIRRLSTSYYGWGAITSDVNHDGTLDVSPVRSITSVRTSPSSGGIARADVPGEFIRAGYGESVRGLHGRWMA